MSLVKGIEELVNEFDQEGSAAGYLACIIAILYFGTVYGLEKLGSSTVWKAGVRTILADYAYVVRIESSQSANCWLTVSIVWNPLLGRLLSLPWKTRYNAHRTRACYQSLLSNAT